MKEFSDLQGRVTALLRETEAWPDFDNVAIAQEIQARYGPVAPDPIPEFWVIADRHRSTADREPRNGDV